jgi:hypothetical protein
MPASPIVTPAIDSARIDPSPPVVPVVTSGVTQRP